MEHYSVKHVQAIQTGTPTAGAGSDPVSDPFDASPRYICI